MVILKMALRAILDLRRSRFLEIQIRKNEMMGLLKIPKINTEKFSDHLASPTYVHM
jgi:hypothetical protein